MERIGPSLAEMTKRKKQETIALRIVKQMLDAVRDEVASKSDIGIGAIDANE